eukprot:1153724-Pelagomonas_calceolata.AAC.6
MDADVWGAQHEALVGSGPAGGMQLNGCPQERDGPSGQAHEHPIIHTMHFGPSDTQDLARADDLRAQ